MAVPTPYQRAFRVGLPLGLGMMVLVLLLKHGNDDADDALAHATTSTPGATTGAIASRSEDDVLRSPVFSVSGNTADTRPANFERALPPDGTPVDQVIAALDARARSGDARAACRIGSELQRCRRLERWETFAAGLTGRALSKEQRRAIVLEGQRLIEACDRIAPSIQQDLPRYHLVAALQGNPHSAAQFVGDVVMAGDLVSDPQLYALYRAHAWRFFELAFEAGHPDAVETWYATVALGDEFGRLSALSGVMPDAWRRPELATALALRANRRDPLPIEGTESAEDLALRQEVEQIYQTRFAHSRWQRQYSIDKGLQGAERELHALQDAHRLRPCE
jgi:hypothetical protein